MSDYSLVQGDCLDVLKTLPADTFDAVVTDPPAGIAFMGAEWDSFGGRGNKNAAKDRATAETASRDPRFHQTVSPFPHSGSTLGTPKQRTAFIDFLTGVMAECLRVARPGAYALVWALPRTSHWTATAIEDAGWVIQDRIAHFFGCLSDDTEILTKDGWKTYHKIEIGSLALAYNVDDDSFRWEPIQEVLVYDYRDTAYRICSDHTDQIVSRNHRCLVERGGSYAFQYAETLQREESVPVLEDVRGLLEALSLPQHNAGIAEPDLFAEMCREQVRRSKDGEASRQESRVRQAEVSLVRQAEGGSQETSRPEPGDVLQPVLPGEGAYQTFAPLLCQHEGEATERQALRASQPSLERRYHLHQQARQLRVGEVRSLPTRIPADGSQGRLHNGSSFAGGESYRPLPNPQGSSSPRQPRPDGQSAEQPHAVRVQQGPQTVRASWFTRSDLARVESVWYEGKVWCVRVPSGAFVARRNGRVFVTGNSGFPKHKSKLKPAVEDWWLAWKPARHATPLNIDACRITTSDHPGIHKSFSNELHEGYRRPWRDGGEPEYKETPAGRWPANLVLSHHESCRRVGTKQVRGGAGTRCRNRDVEGKCLGHHNAGRSTSGETFHGPETADVDGLETVEIWRCHEDCPVRLLDEQAGERKSGKATGRDTRPTQAKGNCYGLKDYVAHYRSGEHYGDSGGPSRFFATFEGEPCSEVSTTASGGESKSGSNATGSDPCPVPGSPGSSAMLTAGESSSTPTPQPTESTTDRCEPELEGNRFLYCPKASKSDRGPDNRHPTVKSQALMRWLVRLIAPPGGLVLDPFAGSGTTVLACLAEGMSALGIESNPEWLATARRRLAARERPL